MRDRLKSLIDTFFASVDIDKFYSQNQKEKLAEWLQENGVIVPPCKIGSKVYRIECVNRGAFCGVTDYKCSDCPYQSREVIEGDVLAFRFTKRLFLKVKFNNFIDYFSDDEVNYTKEEAEKALKEGAE